ncbi:MAG: glycosyltransferase family 2 protein [Thermoleophilia bacterium]|nr:glycosyltransferase family 2 protein [Thermoleophilia bacterium]
MFEGSSIAVVVPCYNEATQIRTVIETMPAFVDRIIVVDDRSPDSTADVVRDCMRSHPNVELLVHEENRGVGAGIATGYKRALDLGMDIAVVMAGDAQMPPGELPDIIRPVSSGEADYSKANRLVTQDAWTTIPRQRFLGNAVLSLLTKIASGYYQVADSQTGYTAITAAMLRRLDLDAMYPRYGYPNDMLVRLNVLRARVVDVASVPVYDVGEVSGIKIRRVLFTMSWLLLKRFFWRLWKLYVVRDFHPLIMFYVLGIVALVLGTLSSLALVIISIGPQTISGSTAVGASILLQSGLLLTLFGMLFDFEHNRPLVSESRPVGLAVDAVTHAPIAASIETAPLDRDGGSRPANATTFSQELGSGRGDGTVVSEMRAFSADPRD